MDRGAWRAAVHAVTESDMTEQQDNNNTPLYGYITFVVQHESPAHFFLWRNGASQSISFYGSVVKKQKQKQKTQIGRASCRE